MNTDINFQFILKGEIIQDLLAASVLVGGCAGHRVGVGVGVIGDLKRRDLFTKNQQHFD